MIASCGTLPAVWNATTYRPSARAVLAVAENILQLVRSQIDLSLERLLRVV